MKCGQSGMHVTMLRLSFAYVIFTAPLLPAHLVDNTSNNWLRMTPFTVGLVNCCLLIFSFYLADLAGDYLKNSAFYLR